MSMQIIDLSCGGWKQGEVINYFGSNVSHMYDVKKDLLAKAPNFTGYPKGNNFGSAFIEGEADQLHDFLTAFARFYDDESTWRTTHSLHNAIDAGTPVIRAYRHAWPGRFPEELPESLLLAKFAQIIVMEERGAGFGHLVNERDSFRIYCLWEVEKFQIQKDCIAMRHMNGFERVEKFETFGFEWPGQEKPQGADLERLWQQINVVANRYHEKMQWFAEAIANDPRIGKKE
jgi:hypothetical protein|uniref:Uncharacterized protein n=1 Tax=Myoviridae sp. ctshb19 TaxID=2825194 RepID=A0A8S5UGQ9_9CAUD|nr:MAG TPA: hypothetical protein [Myoviridae sp. ctshb19]